MIRNQLSDYDFPEALNTMSEHDLGLLAYEIRDFLIDRVSKTGGHIASNLGVVELTIAIHKVFESPKDKIIWDVGHQAYVHKILTGRADGFDRLRCMKGISGFPKREESPHDLFDSGHSSNSISAALGFAAARDLKGEDYDVISVIGDGALTGGIAYEALNNAGNAKSKMIVILNDNEMSISENKGGMSQHLSRLRASNAYRDFKKQVKKTLQGLPKVGPGIYTGLEHLRDSVKYAIVPGTVFEEFGFKYFGPVDGHNLHDLVEILSAAKEMDSPVLIHVVTKKGKGYLNAEKNPAKFHGIGAFDPETGNTLASPSKQPSYSEVFGNKMIQLAVKNPDVIAISAAMIDGTGLKQFSERFPERIFDVGIAEQHAVTFAAGLALNGLRPVVAIYSTFLQRAYDEMMIDVCMQNLPVIFAIDRGGLVGADGETHHGMFDLSYLRSMPNMTVMAPRDGVELGEMMEYALQLSGPCAIRYPRGSAPEFSASASFDPSVKMLCPVTSGSAEVVSRGTDVTILALGKMFEVGVCVCEQLLERGISPELINPRFVKPLDAETILISGRKTGCLITIEDNELEGGFGDAVLAMLAKTGAREIKALTIGLPNRFIEQGSCGELYQKYDLSPEAITEKVCDFLERKA